MEFSLFHPLRLICLAPMLALIAFCWFRSSRPQRSLIAIAQTLFAFAACLAFTNIVGHSIEATSKPGSRVLARDASDSMQQQNDRLQGLDAARFVTFKGEALAGDARPASSDLSGGSDAALGVIVGSGQGASLVVLDSDGRQTAGDLLSSARRLDRPLFALAPAGIDDMRVASVQPIPKRPNQSIELRIQVESNIQGTASFRVTVAGQTTDHPAAIEPGWNEVEVRVPASGRDQADVQVTLSCEADRVANNNSFSTHWYALAPTQIAIVDSNPNRTKGLRGQLNRLGLSVANWTLADITAARLQTVDALVLLSASAKTNAEQQELLQTFVAEGGGLIVVGGESTYSAKTLAASNWKSWLPVSPSTAEAKTTRESFAMVLIIDKSESMQYENRLEMAKQAASQTVQLLDAQDQVGVLAFGTKSNWVSEIAASGDKQAVLSRIAALKVEGETNMYPAIERAQLALEQAEAEHKHLILLTDGVSSPGDFAAVSAKLKAAGISVATVSVSSGAEQLMLKDIARIADGRHYHCDDAQQLPNVLVRAAQQAVGEIAPTRFSTFELEGGLEGVPMDSAPQLTGVVVTSPKEDTVLAYLTDDGQPLIVWREHEQGVVASLVCDSSALLDSAWTSWPGFTPFWNELLAKVEREAAADPLTIQGNHQGDAFKLIVDFVDAGEWNSEAAVEVVVEGGPTLPATLVAPGRYQVVLTAKPGQKATRGELTVRAGASSWRRRWAISRNYSAEFQHVGADADLLRSAALASGGGMIDSLDEIPASALAATVRETPRFRPLWIWFVAAGVLLILGETLLRRWSLRFGAL